MTLSVLSSPPRCNLGAVGLARAMRPSSERRRAAAVRGVPSLAELIGDRYRAKEVLPSSEPVADYSHLDRGQDEDGQTRLGARFGGEDERLRKDQADRVPRGNVCDRPAGEI